MTETAPDVGEHEGNIPSFRYHLLGQLAGGDHVVEQDGCRDPAHDVVKLAAGRTGIPRGRTVDKRHSCGGVRIFIYVGIRDRAIGESGP